MTNDQLKSLIQDSGLRISEDRIPLLEQFVDFFVEKNKTINLTKINSRNEFLIKHILDSLLIDKYIEINPGARVADLGTGGGLPGIPLAILNPKTVFTLIDSVQKKIKCVEEFISQLELNNINCLSDRLEAIGQDKKYREQFDLVIARAIAPLPVLLELALPLVKKGGLFIAMKGPGYKEEINEAANALKQLRIGLPKVEKYELPEGIGTHYLLMFRKNKPTPSIYPRRTGIPNKNPL